MTDLLKKELESIQNEFEKLESSLPQTLSQELADVISLSCDLIQQIDTNVSSLVTKASKVQYNSAAHPICFWVEKTANLVGLTLSKHQEILRLETQFDLYRNALAIEPNEYLISSDIKDKRKALDSKISTAKKVNLAKEDLLDQFRREFDAYSVAFENQMASHSLSEILSDTQNRTSTLEAMSSLGEIFRKAGQEQSKLNRVAVCIDFNSPKKPKSLQDKPPEKSINFEGLDKLDISEIHYDYVNCGKNKHMPSQTLTAIEKTNLPQVHIPAQNSPEETIPKPKYSKSRKKRKSKRSRA